MIILKQTDKRWADQKLGGSSATVGRYGCVVTCIAMALDWAGSYKDPKWLARFLSFTASGLLLWGSLKDTTALKFLWRGYPSNFNQMDIDIALKAKDEVCLLNVDGGSHWVLGIYRVPMTKKYWVADPLTGSRKFYSGVVGYSILKKK